MACHTADGQDRLEDLLEFFEAKQLSEKIDRRQNPA